MASYRIYARDSGFNRVAEVDDYQELTYIQRMNGVGSWRITVPQGGNGATHLTWRSGIEIVRDGMTLLSGPVGVRQRLKDGRRNRLEIGGPDDLQWIADRVVLPVPSGPPYSASAHDDRSGIAETVMKAYVDYHAGSNANAQRRVSGLTIQADAASGASVSARGRFSNLLEVLAGIALVGGDLGFRVVQVGGGIQFQVYVPADKTATVVFSFDLGTLLEIDYSEEAPLANYVIVAGQGEGTARNFSESGESTSIVRYGRKELFKDRRDLVTADLPQAVQEELDAGASRESIRFRPGESIGIAYVDDYVLGDKVTVMIDGEAHQDSIREVEITLTPEDGEVIRPVVGTPARGFASRTFDRLDNLDRRTSNLERR